MFVSTGVIVLIESVCDRIPIESISIKFVKNSIPYNMIF